MQLNLSEWHTGQGCVKTHTGSQKPLAVHQAPPHILPVMRIPTCEMWPCNSIDKRLDVITGE